MHPHVLYPLYLPAWAQIWSCQLVVQEEQSFSCSLGIIRHKAITTHEYLLRPGQNMCSIDGVFKEWTCEILLFNYVCMSCKCWVFFFFKMCNLAKLCVFFTNMAKICFLTNFISTIKSMRHVELARFLDYFKHVYHPRYPPSVSFRVMSI